MKVSTKENTSHADTRTTQTKKLKTTRNVEIGWIHSNGNVVKQVRAKKGGGTRKIQLDIHAGFKDILQEGRKLFFLDGISPKGLESDFEFEVWDFKQNRLTDDTCLSVDTMYETARLTMLHFYIATKPKELEDDASEKSEVILVSAHSGNEINTAELQVGDVMDDFDADQPASEMSVVSEITFGPLYVVEQVLFNNVYGDLKVHFMHFVNSQECEVLI